MIINPITHLKKQLCTCIKRKMSFLFLIFYSRYSMKKIIHFSHILMIFIPTGRPDTGQLCDITSFLL